MAGFSIKWDFTGRCNLRCSHCSVGKTYFDERAPDLALAARLRVLDRLIEGGVTHISFLGGEPMITGEDFYAVLARARREGVHTTLVTNGTLLDASRVTRLIELGVNRVVVSIEGAEAPIHDRVRGSGTFERVLRNLRGLCERGHDAGVETCVNTVINRHNLPVLDAMVSLWEDVGIDEWSALSFGGIGFGEDSSSDLALTPGQEFEAALTLARYLDPRYAGVRINPQFMYPLMQDWLREVHGRKLFTSRVCCSATMSLGFVNPFGELFPCDRVYVGRFVGEQIGGVPIEPFSLLERSFQDIWRSEYFVALFKLIHDPATYRSYHPCNRCRYLKNRMCNPCPLYSLQGDVRIPTCLQIERELGDISTMRPQDVESTLSPFVWKGEVAAGEASGGQDLDAIPIQIAGVRTFEDERGLVLMSPSDTECVGLDQVGASLWEFLDGTRTVSQLLGEITDALREAANDMNLETATSGSDPVLQQRLLGFLSILEKKRLIRWAEPTA